MPGRITFTIGYFNPPCDVNFDGVGVEIDDENVVLPKSGEDVAYKFAEQKAIGLSEQNSDAEEILGNAA